MLSLRPYQIEASAFLGTHDRAMVLAPVGAGKTAITLTAMQASPVRRWLVLAPKRVATSVWPAEARKWAPALDVAVAVGTPAQRLKALDAQVVVVGYDNARVERLQALRGSANGHGYVKVGCPLERLGWPYACSDPLRRQYKPPAHG